MATRRKNSDAVRPRRPPATTPEAREQQLAAYAYDLAEKQIMEGTASSQVITHFLKVGSSREAFEKEKLALEAQLLEAKREAMASAQRMEVLYEDAIKAMRSYAGMEQTDVDFPEE